MPEARATAALGPAPPAIRSPKTAALAWAATWSGSFHSRRSGSVLRPANAGSGASCATQSDCQPGHVCLNGAGYGCLPVCSYPNGGCPLGLPCQALSPQRQHRLLPRRSVRSGLRSRRRSSWVGGAALLLACSPEVERGPVPVDRSPQRRVGSRSGRRWRCWRPTATKARCSVPACRSCPT
jgi:hypothetical protein